MRATDLTVNAALVRRKGGRLERSEEILEMWFGPRGAPTPEDRFPLWFGGGPAVDRMLRETREGDVRAAIEGRYDRWAATPRGRMALLVLLDQLPRNIWRGTAAAFSGDPKALALAKGGTELGMDLALTHTQRMFFYLPFEHSEDRAMQLRSVQLFRNLHHVTPPPVDALTKLSVLYAERHREIVERFGRFPHRNRMLGRETTPAEAVFLTTPMSSF